MGREVNGIMNLNRLIVVVACIWLFYGCASQSKSEYPPELQMIIASSGQQQAADTSQNAEAISVAQLLSSVKQAQNADNSVTVDDQKANAVKAHPNVPEWIFSGKARSNASSNTPSSQINSDNMVSNNTGNISPQTVVQQVGRQEVVIEGQRQIQLNYNSTANNDSNSELTKDDGLPNRTQLMMAKHMVIKQQMLLIKLTFGTSSGMPAMASAANAQKRARQLLIELYADPQAADKRDAKVQVEYRPKIGEDVVVATFIPRSAVVNTIAGGG